MKKINVILLIFMLLAQSLLSTGCWNYREIDKMAIAAGVAVDKGTKLRYLMTVEMIKVGAGKDIEMTAENVSSEGDTLFDAIRNIISLSGKKLYFGHAQVIIFSKDIAQEGIHKVIDWYKRDAETREDVKMLISKEATAKEIFSGEGLTERVKSITLSYILDNEVSLSKAPKLDITKYDIQYYTKGAAGILPAVSLRKMEGRLLPEIMGTAVIKNDKLIGFLSGEETKYLLFIKNEIKGGLLNEKINLRQENEMTTLEIFESKTKIKPELNNRDIKMDIKLKTTVAIDEIEGKVNLIDEAGTEKVKKIYEKRLEGKIVQLIQKMQKEYDADIFGFGTEIHRSMPRKWKKIENNWDELFKKLKVSVTSEINIKNSGVINKPLEESE